MGQWKVSRSRYPIADTSHYLALPRGDAAPMTMSPPPSPSVPTPTGGDLGSDLSVVAHDHGAAGHPGLTDYPDPPPRDILDAAGELLRALAAPVRIAIVLQLRESHRCVHELVDALGVPQPLVSPHL